MSVTRVTEHLIDGHRVRDGACEKHGKTYSEIFHPFNPRFAEFLKKEGDWVGGCPDCKAEADALARDEAEANRYIDSQAEAIRAFVMAQMETPEIRAEREKAIAELLRVKASEYEQNIRPSVEAEVNEEIFERLALAREDTIRSERLAKKGASA